MDLPVTGSNQAQETFGLFVPFYVNIKVHSAILSVEGRATQMCGNVHLILQLWQKIIQPMNCDTEEVSIRDLAKVPTYCLQLLFQI